MDEILEIFFGVLARFIYPQYTLAVIGLTEALKFKIKKERVHPRYVTLVVGLVLGVIGVLTGHLKIDADNIMRVINSYAFAGLLYTYVIRIIRARYNRIVNE